MHGRRDLAVDLLQSLGFVDEHLRWTGGTRRLVQVGDIVDRGPEPLGAIDLLMRLQREAREAGGEVVCLVGNHELFALRAGAGDHSSRLRWSLNGGTACYREWAARLDIPADELALPYPEAFYTSFGPTDLYGRWIRSNPIAVQVGEYVVVHAGWTPAAPGSLEEANSLYAAALADPERFMVAVQPGGELAGLYEMLWARRQPEEEIRTACDRLGCKGLIAGHTPVGGILTSCEGRLVQIDVGMYVAGAWGALGLDDDGKLWALMAGQEPMPIEADGLIPLAGVESAGGNVEPPTQQHGAGAVLLLYETHDGQWAEYFQVLELVAYGGAPGYRGRFLTRNRDSWSAREVIWPSDRLDRFGRAVDAAALEGSW